MEISPYFLLYSWPFLHSGLAFNRNASAYLAHTLLVSTVPFLLLIILIIISACATAIILVLLADSAPPLFLQEFSLSRNVEHKEQRQGMRMDISYVSIF